MIFPLLVTVILSMVPPAPDGVEGVVSQGAAVILPDFVAWLAAQHHLAGAGQGGSEIVTGEVGVGSRQVDDAVIGEDLIVQVEVHAVLDVHRGVGGEGIVLPEPTVAGDIDDALADVGAVQIGIREVHRVTRKNLAAVDGRALNVHGAAIQGLQQPGLVVNRGTRNLQSAIIGDDFPIIGERNTLNGAATPDGVLGVVGEGAAVVLPDFVARLTAQHHLACPGQGGSEIVGSEIGIGAQSD